MKWIGPAAMAVLLAGSCSRGEREALSHETAVTAAAGATQATIPKASTADLPAGDYKLDPTHATLHFSVSHLGFSNYTAQFTAFDAGLKLDPANPSAAILTASVDPMSLQIPAPPAGFLDELKGEQWIDAIGFPSVEFRSTAVNVTGPNTAEVTGDLKLRGVIKPVTLQVTFNGGYAGHVYEPNARIGFSARGTFKRSDFGISYGIPEPGSNMGVSDEIAVTIEAEFTGPAWKDAPPATPPAN